MSVAVLRRASAPIAISCTGSAVKSDGLERHAVPACAKLPDKRLPGLADFEWQALALVETLCPRDQMPTACCRQHGAVGADDDL